MASPHKTVLRLGDFDNVVMSRPRKKASHRILTPPDVGPTRSENLEFRDGRANEGADDCEAS
jgi:hypothetical protein